MDIQLCLTIIHNYIYSIVEWTKGMISTDLFFSYNTLGGLVCNYYIVFAQEF